MKIDLTGVKNIIFDLGNVIVNLDFDATINAFNALGSNVDLMDHKMVYADETFYNIEVGKISPSVFLDEVRKILKDSNLSDNQIVEAWCAMFLDTPENRVKKLQELGEKYNLYVFSNTNQLHIDRFIDDFNSVYHFDFNSLFTHVYYSHDIHERKPDVSAFEKVIELSGVTPDETLFIDDLEKNISGAQKAGLKTFWLQKGMEMAELL
jgi:putative hydrolase of the HAD superfamily